MRGLRSRPDIAHEKAPAVTSAGITLSETRPSQRTADLAPAPGAPCDRRLRSARPRSRPHVDGRRARRRRRPCRGCPRPRAQSALALGPCLDPMRERRPRRPGRPPPDRRGSLRPHRPPDRWRGTQGPIWQGLDQAGRRADRAECRQPSGRIARRPSRGAMPAPPRPRRRLAVRRRVRTGPGAPTCQGGGRRTSRPADCPRNGRGSTPYLDPSRLGHGRRRGPVGRRLRARAAEAGWRRPAKPAGRPDPPNTSKSKLQASRPRATGCVRPGSALEPPVEGQRRRKCCAMHVDHAGPAPSDAANQQAGLVGRPTR